MQIAPAMRICDAGKRQSSGARKSREAVLSAYDDFTDLDDRGLVGIVWDVCHDLLGMRPKTSLECLDGVAEDVTHSDIRRRSAGCSARKSLVNSVTCKHHPCELSRVAYAYLDSTRG